MEEEYDIAEEGVEEGIEEDIEDEVDIDLVDDEDLSDEDALLRDIATMDIRASSAHFDSNIAVKGIIDNVESIPHTTSHYLDIFELSNVIDYVKSVMPNEEYHKAIDNIIAEYKNDDVDFIAWTMIERGIVPYILYRSVGDKVEKIRHTAIKLKPRNYYY